MNIAQSIKSRYESEDFKNNYKEALSEMYYYGKGNIIEQIICLFNVSNYETQKYLKNHFTITREQAVKIFEFIKENFDDFISDYSGYYVGYTSLISIEYGEQEEQLIGIWNRDTNKPYSLKYLRQVFKDNDYCINRSNPDYAYLNLSGGLHIDLLKDKTALDNFLLTIK